jgi:glutamate N-acetyltransferase/amino-acid N-acetyltransferase
MEHARSGAAQAIVASSGCANVCTGERGLKDAREMTKIVADLLRIPQNHVLIAATGVIGVPLPMDRVRAALPKVVKALSPQGGRAAAEAIMTTDTVAKQVVVEGEGWSIGGMAKGAGMLAPALATMLVVITTDADLTAAELDQALRAATRVSFDRLDSDGCMSTNDTVTLLASGASGVRPSVEEFTAALTRACSDLALQLLADAEGADHSIAITTLNAATEDDAVEVSRSVARSNLFKAAIFGKDPNWGRILASVGTTGAAFDPADLDVALNGVWVCKRSTPAEDPSLISLEERDVTVTIDLKAGDASATVWTNDLTHAYVHENSAYSS